MEHNPFLYAQPESKSHALESRHRVPLSRGFGLEKGHTVTVLGPVLRRRLFAIFTFRSIRLHPHAGQKDNTRLERTGWNVRRRKTYCEPILRSPYRGWPERLLRRTWSRQQSVPSADFTTTIFDRARRGGERVWCSDFRKFLLSGTWSLVSDVRMTT